MSGNSAIGEAAIRAGCQCYFGYPITPQNELPEYMAANLSRRKGCAFVQAESELSAINMLYGASATGVRAMTSSSSPGISLADFTNRAFDLADKYLIPVIILGDGMLGQMMEPIEFKHEAPEVLPVREHSLRGAKGRPSRFIKTFTSNPAELEEINWSLFRRYQLIMKEETTYDTFMVDDAHIIVVAFGIAARIAKGAIKNARQEGLQVGFFRPTTLWPYPSEQLQELAKKTKHFLVFEMNMGQMIEDVQLAVAGKAEVHFYGRPGGVISTPSEVQQVISRLYHQKRLKRKK